MHAQGDTLLVADVLENSRNMCPEMYKLDPAKLLSGPGLVWQAALRICHSINRYEKANNKHMGNVAKASSK